MLNNHSSHCRIFRSLLMLMFLTSVYCELQSSDDVSVNCFNSHAQVRQPEACSGIANQPMHTVGAID